MRDRPHLFEVSFLRGSIIFPDVELTVDTPADFKNQTNISKQLLPSISHQSKCSQMSAGKILRGGTLYERNVVNLAVICAGDGLHARLMLTIFQNGLKQR